MDEFNRIHGKFELFFHSAKKGDRRSLIMAKRAATEMKQLIESQYYNKSGPRILRRSYNFENWMDKQTRRAKVWN